MSRIWTRAIRMAYPPSAQATKPAVGPVSAKKASPATAGGAASIAIVGARAAGSAGGREGIRGQAGRQEDRGDGGSETNGDRTGWRRSDRITRRPCFR